MEQLDGYGRLVRLDFAYDRLSRLTQTAGTQVPADGGGAGQPGAHVSAAALQSLRNEVDAKRAAAGWIVIRRVCADWRCHLEVVVRPDTVLRWHRLGWRVFWWWRSRRPTGRPRLPTDMRDPIASMSRDNPRWGTERIRGELHELGIAVSRGSIRRYRWRGPARPARARALPVTAHPTAADRRIQPRGRAARRWARHAGCPQWGAGRNVPSGDGARPKEE